MERFEAEGGAVGGASGRVAVLCVARDRVTRGSVVEAAGCARGCAWAALGPEGKSPGYCCLDRVARCPVSRALG